MRHTGSESGAWGFMRALIGFHRAERVIYSEPQMGTSIKSGCELCRPSLAY